MNHYHAFQKDYLAWYNRTSDTMGEPFDPTLFVHLAQQQWSDRPELALAFARCKAQWAHNELYTYFLAPMHHTARWKFAGSLFLDHPALGTLLVDVLNDANAPGGLSIGGMEFFDRVTGHETSAVEMNGVRLRMTAQNNAQRNVN